ncbi:MAG: hypothetical protein H7A43_11225 [Verrucomicrobia bacterium]|nr:hypothetical protein [Verrucomicrobiota bacterium]
MNSLYAFRLFALSLALVLSFSAFCPAAEILVGGSPSAESARVELERVKHRAMFDNADIIPLRIEASRLEGEMIEARRVWLDYCRTHFPKIRELELKQKGLFEQKKELQAVMAAIQNEVEQAARDSDQGRVASLTGETREKVKQLALLDQELDALGPQLDAQREEAAESSPEAEALAATAAELEEAFGEAHRTLNEAVNALPEVIAAEQARRAAVR